MAYTHNVYAYTHTHTHAHTVSDSHTHTHTHTHAHTHTHTRILVLMHTRTHAHTCTMTQATVSIRTWNTHSQHTMSCTCTHTCMHTYTHALTRYTQRSKCKGSIIITANCSASTLHVILASDSKHYYVIIMIKATWPNSEHMVIRSIGTTGYPAI